MGDRLARARHRVRRSLRAKCLIWQPGGGWNTPWNTLEWEPVGPGGSASNYGGCMAAKKKPTDGRRTICENRKARHDYHIIDTLETGIVLSGSEVKSLRAGTANLVDSYVRVASSVKNLIND